MALSSTIDRLVSRWGTAQYKTSAIELLAALEDPDGGRLDFVSRAFLVHLAFPESFPIIDRFNHRAVRWFVGRVRNGFALGRLPSHHSDVTFLKIFIEEIRKAWGPQAPTEEKLDRFLMMFGKHVAPRY